MSHRAALAVFLMLPLLAIAGAVPVCDGTITQSGAPAVVECSVAWRFIDEPIPSWLGSRDYADVGLLAGVVLLLWSVAWVLRLIRVTVQDHAP